VTSRTRVKLKYHWNGDRVDRYFDYLRDAWVDLLSEFQQRRAPLA
jgi:hypothetical protein